MKLIAQVKLLATPEQHDALRRTVIAANAAADYVSRHAWASKTFGQYDIHADHYKAVRKKFGLSAQVTVRLIAKVADAYRADKKSKRFFRPLGSVAYDERILSYNIEGSLVSIWSLDGRLKIPFVCGIKQRELLRSRQGESDLCLVDGQFYLSATCDIEPPRLIDHEDVLGVDLGIVNVAVDSDGTIHSGKKTNAIRYMCRHLRSKLQSKGTKSAKRKLKKLSGKERKFAKDVNHCISKKLVKTAEDTKRAIALEDLKGIRKRKRFGAARNGRLSNWSFHQLQGFVKYKAELAGIPVIWVDPRNTSITCPACGCVDKKNRKTQSKFLCVTCGHSGLADHIAAINIRGKAVVNQPIAGRGDSMSGLLISHSQATAC